MSKYDLCVIGQGFVGLPLALSFAIKGKRVIGVDNNKQLGKDLINGITNSKEKYRDKTIGKILKEQILSDKYRYIDSIKEAMSRTNNIVLTVGVPVDSGRINLDSLEQCCSEIGENLKIGDFILIRSTLTPGTTEETIIPIIEKMSKLKAGIDFYVAYSSERIAEGKAFEEFQSMPTLIGAICKNSMAKAKELLSIICDEEIIEASSIKAVETAKIMENIQRDVNIAMAQEFARFTEVNNLDIFEVIRLTNTHKRVNLLLPGPGVGGYCIPNAYYYLKQKADKENVSLDLCKTAREINENVPQIIVNKIEELLKGKGKSITSSKVAVLGLAMKDNTNDIRLSPAIQVCELLLEKGIIVNAYDGQITENISFKVNTIEEAFRRSDAIVVLAKQNDIGYTDLDKMKKLMNINPIFIDTKNVIDNDFASAKGFSYWRI
jgi:UDP-N-acetyl-D-mannosaminuronic acid dehydrogenase